MMSTVLNRVADDVLERCITHATAALAKPQRPDGHLAPAWGRYAANTLNNVIENAWLPPSVTTPGQTARRSASGFVGRLIGNMYEEFWPDARRLLFKKKK